VLFTSIFCVCSSNGNESTQSYAGVNPPPLQKKKKQPAQRRGNLQPVDLSQVFDRLQQTHPSIFN
jgi:hypothetical protein